MYCSKDVQPAFRVERLKMPLRRLCDPSCHVRLDVSGGFAWSGGEWSRERAGRYVWSVLNGFANDPLYVAGKKDKSASSWRLLDGWQRVEAVVAFAEDRLRLPTGFVFHGETWGGESVEAGGMTLSQVRERYPYVARRFDTAIIPVAHVKGDDAVLAECVARLHGEMA